MVSNRIASGPIDIGDAVQVPVDEGGHLEVEEPSEVVDQPLVAVGVGRPQVRAISAVIAAASVCTSITEPSGKRAR